MVEISPISIADARKYFEEHSAYRGEFNLAIAAKEPPQRYVDVTNLASTARDYVAGSNSVTHGVIAMIADGDEFSLGHISTDGSAHIGSLLYGAAWRAAKALGYKRITI